MKKTLLLSLATLSLFTLLYSCTKEDLLANISVTDNVKASAYIDMANQLDVKTGIQTDQDYNYISKNAVVSVCPSITVDNTSFPKTITIDYGTGCTTGSFTRKGILTITLSGQIATVGTIMTIVRSNYYINEMKFEGTITYENVTDGDNPKWTRTITNGVFIDADDNRFTNSGSYIVEQTAGNDTPFVLTDNTYNILSGTHTVTNANNKSLVLTVQETLVKAFSCDYISDGKLGLSSTLINGVIDYGDGTCDSSFTYTPTSMSAINLSL